MVRTPADGSSDLPPGDDGAVPPLTDSSQADDAGAPDASRIPEAGTVSSEGETLEPEPAQDSVTAAADPDAVAASEAAASEADEVRSEDRLSEGTPHPLAEDAVTHPDSPPGTPLTPPVAPPPTPPAAPARRGSLAGKALGALVLLLAGGALGIWAAPRVAPQLPSGMAPVAAWLTPGATEAAAQVAALQSRLDSGLAAASARIDALGSETAGNAQAAEQRLTGAIAELRKATEGVDTASLAERLSQLESAVDGQRGEFDALKQQFSGGAAAIDAAGAEAVQRIDIYRAELDGLRAEVDRLTGQVGGLASRVDEVAATADRSINAAQAKVTEIEADATARTDAARTAADLAALRAALAAGQPFAAEIEKLGGDGGVTLPEGLAEAAAQGAPTLAALRDSFPEAAHAAITASILASAGDGVFDRARAYFRAQVASRSLTPQPGPSPDAVLSRAEDFLRRDDLKAALAEVGTLPSEGQAAMADWVAGARARLSAEEGLQTLGSSLPAGN